MTTKEDFTPSGVKIEGAYENDRNAQYSDLYKAMIRECYGVTDVIIAHHLVYVTSEQRDGFTYQIVEEIPSADTLIFDHDIAQKIWGDGFLDILMRLACEPISSRDALLLQLYNERNAREPRA